MKLLTLMVLIGNLSQSSFANSDDLILQTRVDSTSLNFLVDKTRLILNNADIKDGLDATVPIHDVMVDMHGLSNDPHMKNLQAIIKKTFKVDVEAAILRVRIPRIAYKIHSLHVNPNKLEVNDPSLLLETHVALQGVDINLIDGVQLDFMIPSPTTKKLESYFTAVVDPATAIIPETLPPAQFEVAVETIRDHQFAFNLKSYNLDSLPVYVEDHQSEIRTVSNSTNQVISADQIKVNPVIVKINQLSRTIQFDDFKPIVQKKMPQILGMVFKVVGDALKNTIGPRILTNVFKASATSQLVVAGPKVYSRFGVALFSQPDPTQLSLGVTGDLCTNDLYRQYQSACTAHMEAFEAVRTLSDEDKQKAKNEIGAKISSAQADIALSINEDYLNRLLKTTIDANLWAKMLGENHLELGPKGAFVVLNHANQDPELYLDLYYSGEPGITSILINPRHPIRFPLRMSTSMKFEVRGDHIPYLVITTNKLLSDSDEIINGIPEYDLPSHLVRGLRRKIAGMIIDMAGKLEGQNALDMEIPIFKGLGLEKTWYETSEFGRINLFFKL